MRERRGGRGGQGVNGRQSEGLRGSGLAVTEGRGGVGKEGGKEREGGIQQDRKGGREGRQKGGIVL